MAGSHRDLLESICPTIEAEIDDQVALIERSASPEFSTDKLRAQLFQFAELIIAWLKMHDGNLNGQIPSLMRVVDAPRRCREWESHGAFVVDYIQEARHPFHLEWLGIAHTTLKHEVLLLSVLRNLAINAAFNVHQSKAQARYHLIAAELGEIHIEQSHIRGHLAEAAARDSGNPAVFAARQLLEE
ncbi:hypothetical protein C8Q80DRAFT_1123937 [Daedaleopsis nitida]|nr:hypothetical protein C8Q80DRAFT_1123937 [Daedaleopsis nitida]